MSRTKTTATDGGTGGGRPEETPRSRRYVKGEEQMQTGKAALKRNIKKNNKTTSIFKLFHQLLLSLFLDWVPMTREDTALRENLYIQL